MKSFLNNKRGEGHIDTGVKVIIAVVIGLLILSALYLLFTGEDGIINKLNGEVEGMMDYTQELRYERTYDEESGLYSIRYSYDGKHWHTPTMPEYSETATVYNTMSNNSASNPIEAALIQDGNLYYVISSTDGGVTWTEQMSFTVRGSEGITHCLYGTRSMLPSGVSSFSGYRFIIRYHAGGDTYYTIKSDGVTWNLPAWSDIIR